MMTALALAATAALSTETCLDHTSYTFGFADSRLRNVEILRDEPDGRSERGEYPDGTVVTLSADYCSEREVTLTMDARADAQNIMRLRQVFGQLDRFVSCPISDWNGFDAAMDAAGASLDAGDAYDNGGNPIDGDGVNAIYLSIGPTGERIAATIRCVRPID
ncbi:hypothetical protein [uncultured Maricaulis sp.]|uniref:hypothetical protein n=1 Tax=uncultured Maricaulis sp. TaxID=174710 RepID=UPI00261C7657|nr:hypothetical protein [uncultured Maricaulis sp.]